jgi:hypothetical protein
MNKAPIYEYHVILRSVEGEVLRYELTFQMYKESFGDAVKGAISFAEDDKHEVESVLSVTRKLIAY